MKVFTTYFSFLTNPGAIPLFSSEFEASSVPVFLSSLHCTDEDHSLLDDCAHSQLGLAVCDEDSGLAGAKCLGKKGYKVAVVTKYPLLRMCSLIQIGLIITITRFELLNGVVIIAAKSL